MAVSRTGSATTLQNNATNTLEITIPSDANSVIVYASGQRTVSDALTLISELRFSGTGNHFTEIVKSGYFGSFEPTNIEAHILTSSSVNWPGEGSKTLTITRRATIDNGINIAVQCYSGIDTSSPIVDTDRSYVTYEAWTSSLSDVGAGDLGIISVWRYTSDQQTASLAENGQTSVVALTGYNNCALSVGEELGESQLYMPAATEQVTIAFALKEGVVAGQPLSKRLGGIPFASQNCQSSYRW